MVEQNAFMVFERIYSQNRMSINPKNLEDYVKTDSPKYNKMVEEIRRQLGLTSLKFSKLETLIEAIGLRKEDVCTHCFDGSSFHTLEEDNMD